MREKSARRWLAGLGVAGAFVAASAVPALADDAQPTLGMYFNDTTIAAGSNGTDGYVTLLSSAPVVLHEVTVRYDFSDLSGMATLTGDDFGCTAPSTTVVVCTEQEIDIEDGGLAGIAQVQIKPTAKAADGDTGTLKVTLSSAGFDDVSYDAKVRIGSGVDLAAGPSTKLSMAPGKHFTAPLKVRNAGGTTAKGAAVVFYNDYDLKAAKHYRNCTYVGDSLRSCRFTQDIPVGSSLTASLPYLLGKDTLAPGFLYGEIYWMTPDEFEDYQSYLGHYGATIGKPGTDGTLTPTVTRSAVRGFQADPNPDNNGTSLEVTVTGKNATDLAALGASLTGKAGETVKATVGLRNNGPATLDYSRAGSSVTYLTFDVPPGTTAVEVPENCLTVNGDNWGEPGQPGAAHYRCYFDSFLKAGDSAKLDFSLRIDKVIADATGIVKINVPCQCDGGFYNDLKPANDTAKVVLNATAPAGGGSTGDAGQGGGDGGTLPVTGPVTGLIVGVGGLLLVAGLGGYLVARRRRTRFVA